MLFPFRSGQGCGVSQRHYLPFAFLPKTPPSNLLPGVGVNGVIFFRVAFASLLFWSSNFATEEKS